MRMKSFIWRWGLFFCGFFILSGCGKTEFAPTKEPYVIGVVTKSRNSEYWMSVCSGLEKAAEDFHVETVILSPDSETDGAIQEEMIRELIEKKVDALAISPIDSYDNGKYLKEAEEKGIPVFSYDTPFEDTSIPYIGIDNEKVGYELGEAMAESLNHHGNIMIVAGSTKQASHQDRITGFKNSIATYKEIKIDVVKTGYSNLRISEQELEKLRMEYPEIDGVMTTSAVTALGIAEAMEGTGVKIATVDAQEDALKAVEDGRITVLAAQSGYDIGYETIRYIINTKKGKKQENVKLLETEIMIKENAAQYQNLKKEPKI